MGELSATKNNLPKKGGVWTDERFIVDAEKFQNKANGKFDK